MPYSLESSRYRVVPVAPNEAPEQAGVPAIALTFPRSVDVDNEDRHKQAEQELQHNSDQSSTPSAVAVREVVVVQDTNSATKELVERTIDQSAVAKIEVMPAQLGPENNSVDNPADSFAGVDNFAGKELQPGKKLMPNRYHLEHLENWDKSEIG